MFLLTHSSSNFLNWLAIRTAAHSTIPVASISLATSTGPQYLESRQSTKGSTALQNLFVVPNNQLFHLVEVTTKGSSTFPSHLDKVKQQLS